METPAPPDMSLPRAVRAYVERIRAKVAARADQSQQAPGAQEPPGGPQEAPQRPQEAPQRPQEAPQRPQEAPQRPQEAPGVPEVPENPHGPQAGEPAAAPEAATDPRHEDPKYWEMRYRTEAGTHKASKRTHQEQMDAMQAQLTDLQEQLRVTKASVPLPPVDVAEYFSPEEIEKYGREQCETMARVARQTAEKQADAKVREAVEPLKQQTQASQTRARESAHDQFYGELARIIPNWREIDAMPKWLAWLEEPDPETGLLYGEILDRHAKALNAQQVAKIMQKWQRSQAHPAPPVAPSSSAGAPTLDTQPPSEDALPQGLTPLRRGEAMEYYKRAALNKVSDEERRVFESRLRLGRP